MRNIFIFILLLTAGFGSAFGSGAARDVRGQVKERNGGVLPGVSIVVKGTQRGTVTNEKGEFTLDVQPQDSVLVFSFVGYQTLEEPIAGRSQLSVELAVEDRSLNEIVVVGYGSQKKADITGAVSSVKGSELKAVSAGDASSLLQGRMAGVVVQNGGSAPGQAPAVVIRGTGTFGNDQPLYVIDGMITNSMGFVNPNDVESIEVLKDASAAAIYGSRAANGVVLITTKSGTSGDIKISLNVKAGIQTPTKKLKFLNARQYADWNNLAHDNDGLPRAPGNDAQFNPAIDTDWQDLSLGSAPLTDYNLSLSGGGKNAKFFISGQYFDQKGIVVDSRFKRYNLRANSTFTKGKFKFTESLSASRSVNNPNTYFGRETGELPTMPVYDASKKGGFGGLEPAFAGVSRVVNWYGAAKLNDNLNTNDQILGNIGLEYELLKGLKYKMNVGLDYGVNHSYNFTPAFFFSGSIEAFNDAADLSENIIRNLTTLIEHTLTYNKSFGDHNFELLAGYTSQTGAARSLGAGATDFPSDGLSVVNAALNRNVNTTGDLQEFALQSVLGRLNYNYKSKYLLSATIRRDGSSKFLYPKNTFATFPSFSLGWRVSEEAFFPKGAVVSDLKLRGSYGTLGSQNISNYLTSSVLNVNTDYYFAGGVQPGIGLTNFSNPDIKWESTKTTDFGADVSLLNNAVNITADYFNKKSFDILANIPIPIYGGAGSTITKNAATINNRGFEMAVTYNHSAGAKDDFKYSLTGSFTSIRNRVISLGDGVTPITGGGFTQQSLTATRTDVGQPVGSFWGYEVLGIYQTTQEAIDDGRPEARAGDFKFSKNQTWLGSPFPKFNYGLSGNGSWKNFDISLFFQGVSGNKIWNAKRFQHILDYGSNKFPDVLRSWTPQNTNTDIPRVTQNDPANNKRSSSFYVEDGSYLRLKNITIGYSLPQSVLDNAKIASARFYISAQNILTFTKYSGYDPEIGRNSSMAYQSGLFSNGVDIQAYPNAKLVSVGVDLTFLTYAYETDIPKYSMDEGDEPGVPVYDPGAGDGQLQQKDLDLTNPNNLSVQSFWKTADDAEKGLVACYGPLTTIQGWGRMLGALLTIQRGDDVNPFPFPAVNDPGTFSTVSSDGRVNEGWTELNAIVARANSVLFYVPDISMDETRKKQILGEASFLRALAHFYLLNMWGNIPLITKPIESLDDLFIEQAPQAEVWASIINDAKNAQAALPETVDPKDIGRATWGAATALLGKALLFNKDWTGAAAEFKKIVDKPNLYKLVTNYQDNFLASGNNNSESVWELQYQSTPNGNWGTSGTANPLRGQGWESDVAPVGYTSQGSVSVNKWVYDLFMKQKTKDGKIDPRAYATIIWNYPGAKVYQDDFAKVMTGANLNNFWVRKYLNFDRESASVPGSWGYPNNNRRMIRLADVLLMYAEAINEASGPNAQAYAAINAVRARASMPDIPAGLGQAAFRTTVRDERVLELSLEGDRVFDLLRCGNMAATFKAHPEYRSNSGAVFVEGKHEYLPIPVNDIGANPKLKQNNGY